MKRLLPILLLLCAYSASAQIDAREMDRRASEAMNQELAQDTAEVAHNNSVLPIDTITKKVLFSKVIEVSGVGASELLKRSEMFCRTSKNNFFESNGSRNLGWEAFGGLEKASDQFKVANAKVGIGYESTDGTTSMVIGHCSWRYEGNMMSIVQLMIITGDVILKTKDNRCKISITNLSYTHYNIKTGKQVQMGSWKDEGACSSSGSIEQLNLCDHGESGRVKLYAWMALAANHLIEKYATSVSAKTEDDKW